MPAYLIRPTDAKQGDVLIEDPALKLDISPDWAVLSTPEGIAYAIPTTQAAAIQRVDEQELTPQEE